MSLLDLHSIHLLTACFLKKTKTNTSFSKNVVFYFVFFLIIIKIIINKTVQVRTSSVQKAFEPKQNNQSRHSTAPEIEKY